MHVSKPNVGEIAHHDSEPFIILAIQCCMYLPMQAQCKPVIRAFTIILVFWHMMLCNVHFISSAM